MLNRFVDVHDNVPLPFSNPDSGFVDIQKNEDATTSPATIFPSDDCLSEWRQFICDYIDAGFLEEFPCGALRGCFT